MSDFICVRTKYYKKNAFKSILKHCKRVVDETYDAFKTKTVFEELTKNNFSKEFRKIADCRKEYKEINKKRPRKDFNEVFEHVLVFSRDQFESVEKKAKEKKWSKERLEEYINKYIEEYCRKIKEKYGFEPLSHYFHLDEGHIDKNTGEFKRNIHTHIHFYNYDFKNKLSPLRKIKNKYNDSITGKKEVNPAFSDFQDIAFSVFKKMGFKRGIPKEKTERAHLDRDDFIYNKQIEQNKALEEQQKNIEKIYKKTQNDKETLKAIEENIDKKLVELESYEFEKYKLDKIKDEQKKKEKRNQMLDEEYNKLVQGFNDLKEKITKYINSFKKWFSRKYKTRKEALNQYNKEVATPEKELEKSAELTDNQKAIKQYLEKQEELKNQKINNIKETNYTKKPKL